MPESGDQFLHIRDTKLHRSDAVEHEQARRKRAYEEVSQKPADKIASWLGVLERTHTGHKDDPRVIDRIKEYYHREHVIKPENIPQSYYDLQGEIAVNEGRKQDLIDVGVSIKETTTQDVDGNEIKKRSYTFPEEAREQAENILISNQEQSLDRWVDYMTSDDAPYPMWAKYWAFRSVVKMGKLEKTEDGKARFANREKNTTSSFPVLNQRALANTIGAMNARLEAKGKPKEEQSTAEQAIKNLSTTLSDEEYQKLLSTEDFSKLYAQFLSEIPEYSRSGLEETRGKWVKYPSGSDPEPLVESLEGHPLEWRTADIDTARKQLEGGDFYVYYSIDQDGSPTIPRLAIRMEGSRIAEPPRGIAPNQNLDPYIPNVLEKKLEEFGPEGKAFKKRVEDMKLLTEIDKKTQRKEDLSREELIFLYEMDSKIEGFGFWEDPRIKELKKQRDIRNDMAIVFECKPSQIAHNLKQIRADTKVYIGRTGRLPHSIFNKPNIFKKLQNIEHIYKSFPELEIPIDTLEIGGMTKEEMDKKLLSFINSNVIEFTVAMNEFLDNPEFPISPKKETLKIIRLSVEDLGLGIDILTPREQVYARAQELGLELCPSETAFYLRLKDLNRTYNARRYSIAMNPLYHNGTPYIYALANYRDGLRVDSYNGRPGFYCSKDDEYAFALPKKTQNP